MLHKKTMAFQRIVLATVTGIILTAAAVNNNNKYQSTDNDTGQGFLSTSQTDLSAFSVAARAKTLLKGYSYIEDADINIDTSTPYSTCVNISLTLNGQDALFTEQKQDIMEQMVLMFSDYDEVNLKIHDDS